MRIVNEHGQQVLEHVTRIAVSAFDVSGLANYTEDLPLSDLSGGSYLLTMEMKAGTSIVRRSLTFAIK
jgi:hypothetical protein